MALTIIVTNAGRAALVNAANTGTAPVTIAQVGLSGTALVPSATATALPGEFKRLATISGDVVADDTIHLIVRDEGTDVFTVRSIGLYLADGTLFAIYGQAAVLVEKSAQAMMLIAIDVKFEDVAATTLTFGDANFLNPPATTEQMGVVELATLAEAIAGIDTTRVPAAKMIKDAVTSWLDSRFGANNASIWHPGNDGAGSGLDADLLDGQQGSYYTNITARLGYTPVQQGTGVGQLANSIKMGWSGTRLKATVDSSDLGNLVFDGHITDVWRASNDGAGSGLDADLLDGQQATYYTDITARLGYTPLNSTAYTAEDVKTKLLTVDGAGSGFDADLLDGQHGSYYTAITARLGYTPVDVADYTAADVKTKLLTVDGAGSGFDADLLDGQQGSYYTNITARLGYTPLDASGDTLTGDLTLLYATPTISFRASGYMTGFIRNDGNILYFLRGAVNATTFTAVNGTWPMTINLANNEVRVGGELYARNGNKVWDAGNDGAGSGMDADLLDGQQGSYYTDIAARLGFTPVRQGGGAGQGTNIIRIGWSGSRLKAQVDGVDQGNIVFDAQFGAQNLSSNGYQVLPGGLILQWGNVVAPANGINAITFPIAFPTECLAGFATNMSGAVPSAWASAGSQSATGMSVGHARASLTAAAAGTAAFWWAIGR
ncbi:gp53-like domain-containing protein [Sphingobium sp. MI1205]|uniref:gp53-like domain-containing protein n=1 Tax=Sphingobium sp. MI1205 TaxID=407020 RepID=UPI0007701C2D|nr:phage tail protein [Sphingobium sp. MI1205]AMK16700.1 putative phage tail protein [Sphingobium sp. MI1205]